MRIKFGNNTRPIDLESIATEWGTRRMQPATLDQLAIFGGSPTFSEPLHVGRPAVGDIDRVLDRIRTLLESRLLTNDGPFVREFERRVCDVTDVEHCVAVCNGTMGLQLAIRGLGMTGNVIVPSFTFAATVQSLGWQGLNPIFCDVDPATHCLDPNSVANALDQHQVSGILAVHLWGRPCDVDQLTELSQRFDVPLLFDAAQAFGSKVGSRSVGTFGAAEVFSFHATKVVNAFEGGAITTNDSELAAKLRLLRNFGFAGYDDVASEGTNGKMCEAAAAMGITSIESMHEFISTNRTNLQHYVERLRSIEGLAALTLCSDESNCHYAVVQVDCSKAGLTRDELLDILWAENVRARRYFYPGCHRMPIFSECKTAGSLATTEAICDQVLQLPTGVTVSVDDVDQICDLLELCARNGSRIAARLRSRS